MAGKSVDKKDWGGRMDPLAARPNLFYLASPGLTRKFRQLPWSSMAGRLHLYLSAVGHNDCCSLVVCVLL
jgi:hypothetical protein